MASGEIDGCVWQQVARVFEGWALGGDAAKAGVELEYVVPLMQLATKGGAGLKEDGVGLSSTALRILHLLFRDREVNVFRKVQVCRVYMRITHYYFGWTEAGAFRVWDGYDGEREFAEAGAFLKFLREIQRELLFKL